MLNLVDPKRGAVTEEAAAHYQITVDRELTVRELRLLPHIHHIVVNSGRIDYKHLNQEERDILQALDDAGLVYWDKAQARLGVSAKFWTVLCHIMWLTYAVKAVQSA